jgi:hypothetical protein
MTDRTISEDRVDLDQTLARQKWVKALESGEYIQTNCVLARVHYVADLAHDKVEERYQHCCLGVACQVLGVPSRVLMGKIVQFDGEEKSLPESAKDALGMATGLGQFNFDDLRAKDPDLAEEVETALLKNKWFPVNMGNLAKLNDLGVPFSIIARIIRARPWGLFVEDSHDRPHHQQ